MQLGHYHGASGAPLKALLARCTLSCQAMDLDLIELLQQQAGLAEDKVTCIVGIVNDAQLSFECAPIASVQ